MRYNAIDWIALVLLIIGGINWGLVGLFDLDIVSAIFGDFSFLSRLIFVLVGVSALWVAIFTLPRSAQE